MGEVVSDIADDLRHRISDARAALHLARDTGEFYAVRIYRGELASLYRLANDNDVRIPARPGVCGPACAKQPDLSAFHPPRPLHQ